MIEQSFGARQITSEMAAQPDRLAEKLFGDGVIKLKRGYEISGKVLSPDGSPAEGVKLYAAMQMPEYLNMPPHVLTDSSGAYRFRVPDSDGYCLFVIPSDAVAQSIPIQRDYGVHPTLRLEKGTRNLRQGTRRRRTTPGRCCCAGQRQ